MRSLTRAYFVCLTLAGCTGVIGDEDPVLNAARQQALESVNGLRTINGLRAYNGLRSLNGLSTRNGLRTLNGVLSMNGLTTINGRRTLNGLDVDCEGKTAGVDCTGEPDGLLDNTQGLMASDEGIATAKYLVRCALPADDAIRIRDYTGGLVSLQGELGLAASWKNGQCNSECEEKISACLMAFTNGSGKHVAIEMAGFNELGSNHRFRYQEAAFYGNLFSDPPKMFYCVGDDYYSLGKQLETRACSGYNEAYGECPYQKTGECTSELGAIKSDSRCSFGLFSDTAKSCKEGGSNGASWAHPITTFRNVKE